MYIKRSYFNVILKSNFMRGAIYLIYYLRTYTNSHPDITIQEAFSSFIVFKASFTEWKIKFLT